MNNHSLSRSSPTSRFATVVCAAMFFGASLLLAACGSDEPTAVDEPTVAPESTASDTADSDVAEATATTSPEATEAPDNSTVEVAAGCEDIASLFVTRGSANADLDDPEVNASCEGGDVVVTSNGIPDYTYIETSPGQPTDRDHTFSFPASPTVADTVTPVPYLGTSAVTLGGIPIFGPTEGTGGDVESLPGILSDCGSHNGPSGFHIHLILSSSETDCLFTPDEVAAEPQLVGYAFDGFPIYTGIDQYTSSWELTDESLFATDTWAAHTYVEGSGDLDECNGLTDADGNYAYYTTATFPYIMGCYTGVVDLDAAGGGGGGGGDEAGERPERPERPEGDVGDAEDRPERPEDEGAVPEGDGA